MDRKDRGQDSPIPLKQVITHPRSSLERGMLMHTPSSEDCRPLLRLKHSSLCRGICLLHSTSSQTSAAPPHSLCATDIRQPRDVDFGGENEDGITRLGGCIRSWIRYKEDARRWNGVKRGLRGVRRGGRREGWTSRSSPHIRTTRRLELASEVHDYIVTIPFICPSGIIHPLSDQPWCRP